MADNELFGNSEQLNDTISRAAVVDAIEGVDWYHINKNGEMVHGANDDEHQAWYKAEDIYKAVESVPSAQHWISCKERLPEDCTDVLAWFEYYRYGDYNRLYQMHGIGTYIKEYDSWIINHETWWEKLRVFAWMPLPEPWKGERDG